MAEIGKVHGLMVTTTTDSSQAAAIEALEHGLDDPEQYRVVYQKSTRLCFKEISRDGDASS